MPVPTEPGIRPPWPAAQPISIAGMLPGSLHYRFPSKEGLLLALMERGLRRALATVRAAMEHGHDPLDRMCRALRAHIALLVEGDDAIYVNLYELRGISGVERERIVALRDTYEALWEGMLHSAARGRGRRDPGRGGARFRVARRAVVPAWRIRGRARPC